MLLVLLVCYTAVFIVVTQRSFPQEEALRDDSENGCVADYLFFLMPGLKFKIKLPSLSAFFGLFVFYFQVVWRNSKEIGAAWAIRKDKRLVVSIKYNPGGNYRGYFRKNVLPPIARTLGSKWPYTPPKFTWCPVRPTTDPTEPAAGKGMICSLYLVIGSLIFAGLML